MFAKEHSNSKSYNKNFSCVTGEKHCAFFLLTRSCGVDIASHGEPEWFQSSPGLLALTFPPKVIWLTVLFPHTTFTDPQGLKDNNRTEIDPFPFIALTTQEWIIVGIGTKHVSSLLKLSGVNCSGSSSSRISIHF